MIFTDDYWFPGNVRIRAKACDPYEGLTGKAYLEATGKVKEPPQRAQAAPDPFAGLKGRDYLKAKGLEKPPIKRLPKPQKTTERFNFLRASGDINFLDKNKGIRRFHFLPELTVPEES